MRKGSRGIFSLWKKSKIILLSPNLHYAELKSAERKFTILD